MENKTSSFNNGSFFFVPNGVKRSPSELALHQFLSLEDDDEEEEEDTKFHPLFLDHHPHFPEIVSEFISPLSDNHDHYLLNQPQISSPLDIKSSVWVDSPASTNKGGNQGITANSGSSHEQSDEDDQNTEMGYYDQTIELKDVKRIKRMVSNRESAQRSRNKRQAHLAELEQQVDKLQGDNEALIKQLADASQQFKDATTNNRVLKSNVEALRAKVKLAEDMVARGCLTSSMTHLLQNYLNMPEDYINNTVISRISPGIVAAGDNKFVFGGITSSDVGLDIKRSNGGDVTGNLPDIWNF